MPGADAVTVVLKDGTGMPMVRDKASGFILESDLDLRFTHYQLAIDWNGTEQLLDDPYQYHGLYAEYEELHTPKEMYHHMGAQFITQERDGKNIEGTRFLVYAPHASAVSLVGNFNAWDGRRNPMQRLDYGIWGLFVPNLPEGTQYKLSSKGRMVKVCRTKRIHGVFTLSSTHRFLPLLITTIAMTGKTALGSSVR